ncbi:hypothetical protein SUGI_1476200 [Cryptomeria japonica]|uniref:Ketoreductase domain-containing protein n=1 Tax=Cryptomeria japonica TaxID=3369 RepID=A0AAD3NU00_CRYJA|nr:short-chain type dehydrogenase/reductase-like [Cryptomeria japonica]XP_059072022.1 short-chain type dehydrogenase/reductase-like [Cryptomeria japonica]XP_059072023.1 short-chain type dehydrogenase/reductase-like [Cryptomeria japonica]GLJ58784.1 hypothetical protein SUGI_1476160 [Cryptomeria japonica]GLJ58785.1 hypothetical protein SUGI_1476180 [Cryptomeria japonica]GLJ58786.1 hypothetical protein SUGI_1476200 [Cryptomeria japonica]
MSSQAKQGSSLEGRVAIVTGASRGIGREIALHLAEKGAKVVINYVGNQQKAEEVAAIINENKDGERAIICRADISVSGDVKKLFDAAEKAFGGVHIIVNCAGVLDSNSPSIANTPEEDWDRTFNINCKGAFLCSREAANRLVRGGGGRIINLSSSLVGTVKPGYGAYAATNAAVETMTRILAKELRGTRITANCIAPGGIVTELFLEGKSEELVDRIAMESPFERLGQKEDVAPVAAFLATDDAEWVNGQVIRINGGIV